MGIMTRYRAAADRCMDAAEAMPRAAEPEAREPLTAGQHILHLLLTLVTGGLWLPVWFVRAWRGNPKGDPPDRQEAGD